MSSSMVFSSGHCVSGGRNLKGFGRLSARSSGPFFIVWRNRCTFVKCLSIQRRSIILLCLTRNSAHRCGSYTHLDRDGALPEGCDLKALSRWEGTDEDFACVKELLCPHPTFANRLTTAHMLNQIESSQRAAKVKAERAVRHAETMAREQAAKAAKVAANKAASAKMKQALGKPSKLSTYSF